MVLLKDKIIETLNFNSSIVKYLSFYLIFFGYGTFSLIFLGSQGYQHVENDSSQKASKEFVALTQHLIPKMKPRSRILFRNDPYPEWEHAPLFLISILHDSVLHSEDSVKLVREVLMKDLDSVESFDIVINFAKGTAKIERLADYLKEPSTF